MAVHEEMQACRLAPLRLADHGNGRAQQTITGFALQTRTYFVSLTQKILAHFLFSMQALSSPFSKQPLAAAAQREEIDLIRRCEWSGLSL
jgi:hypothetical protein